MFLLGTLNHFGMFSFSLFFSQRLSQGLVSSSNMVLLISEFLLLITVVLLHHNLMDARDYVLKEGSQG